MTGQNWEPWTPLNLTMPSINLMSGFDTKEVKKAYRNLAKSYHPDKRHTLPVEEQAGAHEKWISIVRAYETLTERTKFDNWINYGNPEGSMVSKSFAIAMPAFMSDPKNQIYILAGCFLIIIIVPAVVIFNTRESDEDELVHPETKKYLPRNIIKALEKILKKKGKDATNQLSDEAWADIYQETIEFLILAHRFEGKINLRTFMTARLSGKGIQEKFAQYESTADEFLPKVTRVTIEHIAKFHFGVELGKLGSDKNKLELQDLFRQAFTFTDKVMQMGKNGYLGYKLAVKQQVEDGKDVRTVKKEEGDFLLKFEVKLEHKDWLSIKQSEAEETFNSYKKTLGLYLCLVNKENRSTSIVKLSNDKIDENAWLTTIVTVPVSGSGPHTYLATMCDNYGQSTTCKEFRVVAYEQDKDK